MREGVRIGVDVGDVRIGVARSDAAGVLAVPLETVAGGPDALGQLAKLVADNAAYEVVVGWPRTLSGQVGSAAQRAQRFAHELAQRVAPVPVRLVDERMSTVSAHAGYRELGLSTRRTRSRIDRAAAAIILQSALDQERTTGIPAGERVAVDPTQSQMDGPQVNGDAANEGPRS